MNRRRLLLGAALLLAGTSAWLWTSPAKAATPGKDGWWTVTNEGLGFTPPAPQVPSGGLYIENGFNGPTAISALTFQVDPGSAVGAITLHISGHPVITSPPIACPITAAGQNYKPEQGGPWSDRPGYDCSKSQVTGKVSSDDTTVTFAAGPLLDNGTVSVVLIAGGNADQIAFDPPGKDALSVTPSGQPGGSNGQVPAGEATGQPGGQPVGISDYGAPGSGSGISSPILGLNPASSAPGTPPALATGAPPASTPVANSSSRTRGTARTAIPASASGSPVRKDLAEVIGLVALVVALVAYTEGFGLLGGRLDRPADRQRPARVSSEA